MNEVVDALHTPMKAFMTVISCLAQIILQVCKMGTKPAQYFSRVTHQGSLSSSFFSIQTVPQSLRHDLKIECCYSIVTANTE